MSAEPGIFPTGLRGGTSRMPELSETRAAAIIQVAS
jgi:hypothetical protein